MNNLTKKKRHQYLVPIFLSILLLHASLAHSATLIPIEVTSISIKPNYKLTQDRNDAIQLTDGYLSPDFYIWKNRKSVGWQSKTPVTICMTIQPDLYQKAPQGNPDGIIRLLFGHSTRAGVKLPRLISTYSIEDTNAQHQVHFSPPDHFRLGNKAWLEIPFQNNGKDICVVIHATGRFLMLDEIQVANSNKPFSQPVNTRSKKFPKELIVNDSVNHLKSRIADISLENETNKLCTSFQKPWIKLEADICNLNSAIEIFDQGSVIYSITNPDTENTTFLSVKANNSGTPIKVYNVRKILVADGSHVYDPLIPENNISNIAVPSGISHYLIQAKTDAYSGRITDSLKISLTSDEGSITTDNIDISNHNTEGLSSNLAPEKMNVVTWGYAHDQPIWRSAEEAVQDQLSHGTNVFVLHTRNLPNLENPISVSDNKSLKKTVDALKVLRNAETILLFLRIDKYKNPKIFTADKVSNLVQYVKTAFMQADMDHVKWALYPIDEPRGENIEKLASFSKLVKNRNPEILIYANPIDPKIKVKVLEEFVELIDIWQPRMNLARTKNWQNFAKQIDGFWVYDNPPSPAKSATPEWYYDLPKQARSVGASGVGFWSYSSTGGSSAWDDFDGTTPDWAVVYESPQGIISSRRWEAFLNGLTF